MIFADLYKSPKSHLSRLRHSHQPALVLTPSDYDADLVSKDKSKQKEAVKRHLQAKVRNDWDFTWPLGSSKTAGSEPEPLASHNASTPAGTANGDIEGYLEVASEDSEVINPSLEAADTALDSGEEPDSDSEAESVYSTISEDPLHWRPRLEWTSELSDDELPYNSPSPFKFDTPDSISTAVTASKIARKARRRKELRKEIAWNDGLACFEARRNAWTGAKVARVRPKPLSPVSPSSPRRGLFWRSHSHSSSNAGQSPTSPILISPLMLVATSPMQDGPQLLSAGGDSDNSSPQNSLSPETTRSDSQNPAQPASEPLLVETLIPIPPPLLPPANPMRASISPALYNSIYEKVIVHSLQPSCPINLGDLVRACVVGWKRDGEWPPRPAAPEPAAVVAVRRNKSTMPAAVPSTGSYVSPQGRKMSFSFLVGHGRGNEGENKEKGRRESATGGEEGSGGSNTGKAFRRSLQKVLGIGYNPTMASMADGHVMMQ